jgi:hypothetical protein
MTKQVLFDIVILICILFSSGLSATVLYNIFVINVLKRK